MSLACIFRLTLKDSPGQFACTSCQTSSNHINYFVWLLGSHHLVWSQTLYLLRTPQGNSEDTEELRPSPGARTADRRRCRLLITFIIYILTKVWIMLLGSYSTSQLIFKHSLHGCGPPGLEIDNLYFRATWSRVLIRRKLLLQEYLTNWEKPFKLAKQYQQRFISYVTH